MRKASHQVNIRLTPEELQRLRALAAREQKTVSGYLRAIAMQNTERPPRAEAPAAASAAG